MVDHRFLIILLLLLPGPCGMGQEQNSAIPSYLEASQSVELPEFTVSIEAVEARTDSFSGAVQRIWSARFDEYPVIDVRVAPSISLQVGEGESVTPFLPPGPFGAEWEATLHFKEGGEHRFSAEGNGKVRVEVHGAVVFEATGEVLSDGTSHPHSFAPGDHPIRVRYESPAKGEAVFRLLWESDAFPVETISPRDLSHGVPPDDLMRRERLRKGREAVAAYRCIVCHRPPDGPLRMKELDRDSPGLKGVGSLFHEEWLVEKILSPGATHPESEMPTLLGARDSTEAALEARLLAAYLHSFRDETLDSMAPDLSGAPLRKRGELLFEEQDCAACHLPPHPVDVEGEEGSEVEASKENLLPLSDLGRKWKPAGLVDFLLHPDRRQRSIRMPDFHFSEEEARALAAFLIGPSTGEVGEASLPLSDDDRAHAEELLNSRRCLSCHAQGELGRSPIDPERPIDETARPLGEINLDRGCLAKFPADRGQSPDFRFDDETNENLRLFLQEGLESLNRHVPSEYAQQRLSELRCLNCHRSESEGANALGWDAFVSVGNLLSENRTRAEETDDFLLEEEAWADIPLDATVSQHQIRPDLAWAGEKLRTEWIAGLLRGDLSQRARPLLPSRMPAFRAGAEELAVGLASLHGLLAKGPVPAPEKADSEVLRVGQALLGEAPGLNCIACHPIGNRPAGSENPGASINLELSPQRLRTPFFGRILRNPQRISPGSPMPQFIQPDGRTAAVAFHEGDAEAQIEAMWAFLESLGSED